MNSTIVKTPPKIFCLTSGKGGVGKTSLTVNLAFAMAQVRRRVLIVDGDLGLANVDVILGLPVQTTIRDVLESERDPMESVVYLNQYLGILPATSGVPEMVNLGLEEHEQLGRLLRHIAAHFQYVLVDTAAGIGNSVIWFSTLVDHIIVVVTPDPTSMTDAYALIKVLHQEYQRRQFHILLNQVQNLQEAQQTFEVLSKVAKNYLQLSLHYLGTVPFEPLVREAIREQVPFFKLAPQSKASQAIISLAERLQHFETKNKGRGMGLMAQEAMPLS